MTDRLTPAMLRDLADILRHQGLIGTALEIAAARREAEHTQVCEAPVFCDANSTCLRRDRDDPGSAAAQHPVHPVVSSVGERKGMDSAAAHDGFAHSLRSVTTVDYQWDQHALSIISRYERDRHNAADRIEAQDKTLRDWVRDYADMKARATAAEAALEKYKWRWSHVCDGCDAEIHKLEAALKGAKT